MKKLIPFLIFFCLLVLSYFTIKPLFISGFFPMHDDTQPSRVYEMTKALQDGMFPVRWSADLGYGYGYPLFNFYAPLAYYVGGVISLFGFNALVATKIMMGIGIVISGLSMYLLAREFWGRWGGIASALLYLYAPYHALNLYVRGDVAELWAYGITPLVFLAVYKVFIYVQGVGSTESENSKLKVQNSKVQRKVKNYFGIWVIVGALSYAGVILAHNLTAMMITPFVFFEVVLLTVISIRKTKRFDTFSAMFLALFLGVLLSAFYWLPALSEMKYTNVMSQVGGKADYRLHFVCPLQLWNSPWGFGGSTAGCLDGMSFRLGKIHILLSLFSVLVLPFLWRKSRNYCYIVIIVLLLLSLILFLTLDASAFIWNALPFMSFLQYPWRFLSLASLFSSFLGGAIFLLPVFIPKFVHKQRNIVMNSGLLLLVIIGAFLYYGKLFQPQTILPKTANDYTSNTAVKWTISKISDEYLPKNFPKPINANDVVHAKLSVRNDFGTIQQKVIKTQQVSAVIKNTQSMQVYINLAYFPAWKLFVDGKENTYTVKGNTLAVTVPKGTHTFEVVFKQTWMEILGDLLSVISIVVLLVGIIVSKREKA